MKSKQLLLFCNFYTFVANTVDYSIMEPHMLIKKSTHIWTLNISVYTKCIKLKNAFHLINIQ